LGDATALRILDEAAKGFSSGNDVIDRLSLTPRKYYRHLKRLREQGIIAYSGKHYDLTPIGRQLHRLILNHALSLLSTDPNLFDTLSKTSDICELRIIDDYNELVKLLNVSIEKSKHDVFLSTRYVELSVAQNLLYALQRGVKVKSLSNKRLDLRSLFKLLKIISRNMRHSSIPSFINNSDYRVGDVPLSFIVIDNTIAVFEIPSDEFKMAFHTTDRQIVKILSDFFLGIWNKSNRLRLEFSSSDKKRERTE
jgi:DNA-binding transcriptional ArsR family regulator